MKCLIDIFTKADMYAGKHFLQNLFFLIYYSDILLFTDCLWKTFPLTLIMKCLIDSVHTFDMYSNKQLNTNLVELPFLQKKPTTKKQMLVNKTKCFLWEKKYGYH